MTDKQIIIDGVDVSGCEWFYKNDPCKNTCKYFCTSCEWVEIQNCMYKYAKRKEQECEELKKIINEAKNSKLDLKSFLVGEAVQNEYEQQLDQLKADREEALKQLEFVRTLNTVREAEIRKLTKTLTEIKEVLQLYNNTTIGTDKGNGIFEFEVSNDNVLGGKLIYCYDTNPAKKALQKISEVENE